MTKQQVIFLCWVLSFASTLGSLFFSEIMQFPPCVLCWYQRIAMYPLVAIFLVGALKAPEDLFWYATPLVATGWFIALYHNLLHYEIIPETASPCLQGVSCATVYINWFGFLTIPMLSFISFSMIGSLLIYLRKVEK